MVGTLIPYGSRSRSRGFAPPLALAAGVAAKYAGRYLANKAAKTAFNKSMDYMTKGSAAPLPTRSVKKKRRKPKRMTKCQKKVDKLERQMKDIKLSEDCNTGTLTYRNIQASRLQAGQNAQNAVSIATNDTVSLESVALQLKFFDPNNPGTLIDASGVAGAYQRKLLFKYGSCKMLMRNNYQSDVKVKLYLCKSRDDTDESPTAAWTAGLANGTNLTSLSDLGQYPTDYNLVTDLWRLKLVLNKVLAPGESVEFSHSEKDIEYDSATTDSHALTYQKDNKAFVFLPVIQGTVGHDTANNEQGVLPCGIDYEVYHTYKVQYDAGANITYTYVSEFLDNFSNQGVQSHQPIPDNVGYSVP